jgi:multidrug resistance efflux pump
VELELEKGRGDVAQREWQILRSDSDANLAPLALRSPQLVAAKQSLAGAQANLKQAELALSRTHFTAPFNALVLDESIEVGQVVAPGAPLATLIGTDRFWVSVSLPVDELGRRSCGRTSAQERRSCAEGTSSSSAPSSTRRPAPHS